MRYIYEIGFIGNVKRLFKGLADSNTVICRNHEETKNLITEDEDALIEVVSDGSDTIDAIMELSSAIEELTEAVIELSASKEGE